jgi:hypothetical protein
MRHQNHSQILNANLKPEGRLIIKPEIAGLLLQAVEHQSQFTPNDTVVRDSKAVVQSTEGELGDHLLHS